MAFLHGVETIPIQKGPVSVNVVRSAVVGLVGIAPIGPKNVLTLISSLDEAVNVFGSQLDGFTIPQALDAIFKQGAGQVLVVNVFDSTAHTANVAAESQTVVNSKASTTDHPVGTVTVKDVTNATTYVAGTDYTIDVYGNIVLVPGGNIDNGDVLHLTYKKLDIAEVTGAEVVGTAGADPTGVKLYATAATLHGFDAKIYIAPGLLELTGVPEELIVAANAYRGVAILDAPEDTSVSSALAARGPSGTIVGWQTGDNRVILAFPMLKVSNPVSGEVELRPYSQFLAGVICAQDTTNGYWWSPSNKEIKGIVGPEFPITAGINDINSQANQLNAAGIVTVFNAFGSGFRTWGNRNASFPTATDAKTFISVVRTADVLHVSVEQAMLQFLDRPLNQALIDAIRETVNVFIRVLVGRGALIDGVCVFTPSKNPPVELAAGQLVFDLDFMPPVAAERVTFLSFINIDYLKKLI